MSELGIKYNKGEFILICGESGSGKTTLLKKMKQELGLSAGYVSQNIRESMVTDKVWHELAFGLENLGYPSEFIRRRVAEMSSFFGLGDIFTKKTTELSGGEAQLVLLASVMSMEPEVLLLDEPTAMLDPVSAEKLISILEKIHNELGTSIIIAEHRFSGLLSLCDRMVFLEDMQVKKDGKVSEVCDYLYESKNNFYESLPVYVRAFYELSAGEKGMELPLSVNMGRKLNDYDHAGLERFLAKEYRTKDNRQKGEKVLELKKISFAYEKGKAVLDRMSATFYAGTITALLGANGSGKTTLLNIIAGMEKDFTGSISAKKGSRILLLTQNPRLMFMKDSIREELTAFNKMNKDRLSEEELNAVCKECGIEHILDRHPYDVSGGELQKAALAKILVGRPDIILLDEPTKGMENHFKTEFAALLGRLCEKGITVIMASHDLEFAAKYADSCLLLFNGDIIKSDDSDDFFSGNEFYTTDGRRMLGTGKKEGVLSGITRTNCGNSEEHATKTKSIRLPVLLMLVTVFLLVPATVFFGSVMLDNRKYYFVSLLVMLELLLPAYIIYEARKPGAIEIVVIASMCALTVTGRVIFYMLPTIKPVIALVMMAGLAFGPLDGMIVGASSMLVSNMFFGQGPWTPWQMSVFALIGFLSGLIGRNQKVRDNRVMMCAVGVLMTIVVFGGIMNPASIIMYEPDFNGNMIKTAYMTGFPLDLLTAAFTVIFIWFGLKPVMKRCDRVKRYMN
ncbi:MAG: ATP-binding cassette domain-containing protein [Lachnospiraceae bacterium]|nr:ATP-binding cassette domain-containing protein [Lachnospiraceae bacterium]